MVWIIGEGVVIVYESYDGIVCLGEGLGVLGDIVIEFNFGYKLI